MDSETDSESELPPSWEIKHENGKKYYHNYMLNQNSNHHPLKVMRNIYKQNISADLDTKPSRSCLSAYRRKRTPMKFIQKYDAFTTSEQVLGKKDLSGKYVLLIGGCSGIGLELLYHLVSANCHVIVGVPCINKCSSDIQMKVGLRNFEDFINVVELQLKSLKSVQNFVKSIDKHTKFINIVILNAAIMAPPFQLTEDGFEEGFQVNVLSQAYLIRLLLEKYNSVPDKEIRFILSACESHRTIKSFDIDQLNPTVSQYSGLYSYSLHHLCRLMIANYFHSQFTRSQNSSARVFITAHPGNLISNTALTRYCGCFVKLVYLLSRPFAKTLSQACGVLLYTAITGSISNFSGSYFNNYCICEPSELAIHKHNQNDLIKYLNECIHSKLSVV